MSEIKRPDTFSGLLPDDEVFVEALPDTPRRVFRRHDGHFTDISPAVDAVDVTDGGFRIGGRKLVGRHAQTVDRWSAEVEADAESSETHLRGRVK